MNRPELPDSAERGRLPKLVHLGVRGHAVGSGLVPSGIRTIELLLTLHPRRLKFVAVLPPDQLGQARGFPSQGKSEARHG